MFVMQNISCVRLCARMMWEVGVEVSAEGTKHLETWIHERINCCLAALRLYLILLKSLTWGRYKATYPSSQSPNNKNKA